MPHDAGSEQVDELVMTARTGAHPSKDASPRWEVTNGVLRLVLPDGTPVTPAADDIYRAAVEGDAAAALPMPISPHGLGEISFSRFPLLVQLRIGTSGAGDAASLDVMAYAIGGEAVVPLPDVSSRTADHVIAEDTWYPLARGALEEARKILTQAGVAGTGPISLRQYLSLIQLIPTNPSIVDMSGDAASALRQRAYDGEAVPPGFAGTLYPYQRDGWRWLALVAEQGIGGILADEMGLGKTVQLAALLAEETAARRTPSLVVATGTLLENWRRELAKFSPGARVVVHQGLDRTGIPHELLEWDVVIVSYDTLVRDVSMMRGINWNIVILDEAQAIKNSDTRRAAAVKRVPRRVALAVTGTPVENRLTDLWSIADFALPGFLGDRTSFERNFANDHHGAALLEPLVSPILLRRRVADVAADLPARIDIPQALSLDPAQAAAYEQIRQSIVDEYGASATLVALTKLRMFCAHPALTDDAVRDLAASSTKYERLCEILEEIIASGEKAIVFTSFNRMADLLVADLPQRFSIPAGFIDGRTPISERQATVDKFSAVNGAGVLVLNPRAAGTGLNITAANHVIHYNLEWNPAVEDQASARAYRRGQTRPVTVHRLFYADTVEEVIDQRLTSKRSLAERAVVGVDGGDDSLADIAAAIARSPVKGRV